MKKNINSAVFICLIILIANPFMFGQQQKLAQISLRYASPEEAGFSSERLARLDSILNYWVADSAFPGAELLVAKDGKVVYDKAFGTYNYSPYSKHVDLNTIYDLASLTKVIATTPAAMKLYGEGKLDINAPVVKYLPQFGQNGKDKITIRNLLEHDSGLPPDPHPHLWYTAAIPYDQLERLLKNPRLFLKDLDAAHQAMWDSLYAAPLRYPTGTKMIYSDIGMLIVGKVIEKISGMSLDKYVEENFYKPMGMTHTMFNPPDNIVGMCAPTEFDSASGALLQGVVHDKNARSLGGAAGHAGLFSTASDLAVYLQMILNGGVYDGRRYLPDSVITLFTRKQSNLSTRGLGWDTKAPKHSSAGKFFSPTSFGHLGFTGTSVWVDPVRKLFVVFLTNRVCPTRVNNKIEIVRPIVHDAVIEACLPVGRALKIK
ncbi:MAG: serine hydrolase domain-containing protein [Ignavibacteriaceae bacterium]